MKSIQNHILLLLSVVALLPLFASCGQDYQEDIDRLNDRHSDIERRVANLESQVNVINNQISQLAVLSTAIEHHFYATAVTPTADGYRLTLSNGKVLVLQNAPGNKLVPMPSISMTQVNGLFYWTTNGMLLTDESGKPIRTADLTPVVKYDFTTEEWLISIDGGTTFQTINFFASMVINDEVLVQVINSYFRVHSSTFLSQQMIYQIVSTYIQRNYAELFNINILNEVVATYIQQNYTRLFSYELLEKIFTQYDFEYYTSQIEVDKLVDVIITFIQENNQIFLNEEVLGEIISNYIEVNKTTIFTNDMLVEIVNDFIENHSDYINVELLTQIVGNYIDEHRDTVFNTEVVRTLLMRYLEKYYVQVFSQDILVRLLNMYVAQNTTTIFNETLINEIVGTYVENNHSAIFTQEMIREIVNNYVQVNASTIFNRDILVEVITNYFSQNYNLFIDRTTIETIVRNYVEEHHTTIISVDIIESIVYNYLKQYYREVFDYDILNQLIVNYFEHNQQVIAKYVGEYASIIRDVNVFDDRCEVTLGNGSIVNLVVYDAFASLRKRVQSIVVMPNAQGHVNETKGDGSYGYLYLNYMVSPANMASVIQEKCYSNEITLELKVVDEEGNISSIPVDETTASENGLLHVSGMTSYGTFKNVALYVKENKVGGTDFMTEFTPIDAETHKGYPDCPDDHHPHMIDLGLPSGTLWSCCNLGASKPEDYGSYFAWGETYTKERYDYTSYTLGHSYDQMVDIGNNIAGTNYDAATVRWGSEWRMPTDEQILELIDHANTKHEFSSRNSVKGEYFWGMHGGKLFIPAAGTIYGTDNGSTDRLGSYWSANLSISDSPYYKSYCANVLFFYNNKCELGVCYDPGYRENGNPIRPVAAP